ncbi:MAG: acetyltransferase [Candidatus Omnitrophica bacterium]|nr:acetyltransferase [Candidatus Omnitrophota bacterium]
MKVAVLGAGGLAKVICDALNLEGKHEIAGFFDDAKRGRFLKYPILGRCAQYGELCRKLKIRAIIVAFGYNFLDKRLSYCAKIGRDKKIKSINAIHPSAVISPGAEIGKGVYIGPGVIVNPGAKIGDNSVIWSGAIIEHDNLIGKNVFICPGARTAGYVSLGDNTFVGMGANITKARIGKNVTVGAGSLVLDNVKSDKYVFGVPAKIIRTKKSCSYV